MRTENRPLSPHLQIYRPQLTSVLSIMHRLTGIFLAVGTLVLVWWLFSIALGPQYYDDFNWFISSIVGRLLLFAWTFSFTFHLANGIRHMCWDAGWGLDLSKAYKTGWLTLIISIVLTLVIWIVGYSLIGGV
ncbi:MAG: succinate dehydrogenase, cytochrome b556 subunit [Alphaproteobacteria bacterium]|nr:succinate dehydrogenase, cytochrome b556 subunit [Alphaproteobacteria bacterium]